MDNQKPESTIKRVGGYLHRIVPIFDSAGKVINYTLTPIMVEFRLRDMMQVIVGASILAVPVAFTEETWKLGESLPTVNVLFLSGLSLLFIAGFVYFNFYLAKRMALENPRTFRIFPTPPLEMVA